MAEEEKEKTDEQSFFDRPELEAFTFWHRFAAYMRQIKALANYLFQHKRNQDIVLDCLGKIKAEADAIKALIHVTYGLVLDTDPSHTDCVEELNHDHLLDLYFWSMDYQKEIELILNNSSNIAFQLEEELNGKGLQQQIEPIFNSMHAIFSLIANAIKMPLMLLDEFDLYLRNFCKSQVGERMVAGWRKDYLLPRNQLLLQLKEIKSYRPWVDKCRLLHERKIEKRDLFIDKTAIGFQHSIEMRRTNSWLSIFAVMSILREYDEHHQTLHESNNKSSAQTKHNDNQPDYSTSVKDCFKFSNDLVKQKVAAVVAESYHGKTVNLAVIEAALFDHNLLYKRDSHKPFIKALIHWGIIKNMSEEALKKVANGMSQKMKKLPDGGYKGWKGHVNEKALCMKISKTLGTDFPYDATRSAET